MGRSQRQKNKRQRQESSPGKESDTFFKKYKKADSELSESECSLYYEIEDESIAPENIELSQAPSKTSNMTASISKDDLKELVTIIATELKTDLISEIRSELLKDLKQFIEAEVVKTVRSEFEKVNNENKTLHAEVTNLRCVNNKLMNELKSTRLDLDEIEQYGRRMCLELSGLPGDTFDNAENVSAKVLSQAKKCGIQLAPDDIDRCHRLGKPSVGATSPRKIIIKFTNSSARQRLYEARKSLGDGIYVQENLTRTRQQLSFEARQLVRSKVLTKTWVSGCKVYGSLPMKGATDGSTKSVLIKDMEVIQAIRDGNVLVL